MAGGDNTKNTDKILRKPHTKMQSAHKNTEPHTKRLTHSDYASSCESRYMGWLRLVGSLKLQVSFAKEPYSEDDILQKRPVILSSLLIAATLYTKIQTQSCESRLCVITATHTHTRTHTHTHTRTHTHPVR